jgi:hypothetical protein
MTCCKLWCGRMMLHHHARTSKPPQELVICENWLYHCDVITIDDVITHAYNNARTSDHIFMKFGMAVIRVLFRLLLLNFLKLLLPKWLMLKVMRWEGDYLQELKMLSLMIAWSCIHIIMTWEWLIRFHEILFGHFDIWGCCKLLLAIFYCH